MATDVGSELPAGFKLDEHSSELPAGFKVDQKSFKPDIPIPVQMADIGATVASGAVAQPIAGLAGLAGSALPGPAGQGADWVRKTQEALTYQPRTQVGRGVEKVLGIPGKLWQPVVEKGGEAAYKAGGPLAGALTKGALAAAPTAVGYGLSKVAPKLSRPLTREEQATQAAREQGFKLTAEEAQAGPISKIAESIAGEPTLSKVIKRGNQPVVNEIVSRDIGVRPGTDLTPDLFDQLRKEAGVPYEQMRGIGRVKTDAQYMSELDRIASQYKTAARDFPEQARPDIIKFVDDMRKPYFAGDSGIDMVSQLRKSANQAYVKGDKGLGMAMRETADALENQMGRHLEATKAFQPPELLKQWRAARVKLAKINLAEDATNPVTGDVDPTFYARAVKNGKPLTGEAKKLGEAALAHERSIGRTAKLGSTGPTWWDLIVGVGSKQHGYLFMRPAIRALMSSGPYQKMFMRPGPGVARQALSKPATPIAAGLAASNQPEQPSAP